jgi:hypothetical protein
VLGINGQGMICHLLYPQFGENWKTIRPTATFASLGHTPKNKSFMDYTSLISALILVADKYARTCYRDTRNVAAFGISSSKSVNRTKHHRRKWDWSVFTSVILDDKNDLGSRFVIVDFLQFFIPLGLNLTREWSDPTGRKLPWFFFSLQEYTQQNPLSKF